MRIIVWNCNMAFARKYEAIITKRLYDLVQQVNEDRATDTSKTNTVHKFTFNNLLK